MAAPLTQLVCIPMPDTEVTIRAEWHWVCALFERLKLAPSAADQIVNETTPGTTHAHIEIWTYAGKARYEHVIVTAPGAVGRYKAVDIDITGEDDITRIAITYHPAEFAEKHLERHRERFTALIQEIQNLAFWADRFKHDSQKITAEWVIERYYRQRARGSKTTLRELAKLHGFSESYLSQAKRKYDAEGKWGSKSKKSDAKT